MFKIFSVLFSLVFISHYAISSEMDFKKNADELLAAEKAKCQAARPVVLEILRTQTKAIKETLEKIGEQIAAQQLSKPNQKDDISLLFNELDKLVAIDSNYRQKVAEGVRGKDLPPTIWTSEFRDLEKKLSKQFAETIVGFLGLKGTQCEGNDFRPRGGGEGGRISANCHDYFFNSLGVSAQTKDNKRSLSISFQAVASGSYPIFFPATTFSAHIEDLSQVQPGAVQTSLYIYGEQWGVSTVSGGYGFASPEEAEEKIFRNCGPTTDNPEQTERFRKSLERLFVPWGT